jgi:hypothetical protein
MGYQIDFPHTAGTQTTFHAVLVDLITILQNPAHTVSPFLFTGSKWRISIHYTLNISFYGPEPREIQLHGYGNERHGPNKEHSHRIPNKVRTFCDRWEREILLPWWHNQKKQGEKTA